MANYELAKQQVMGLELPVERVERVENGELCFEGVDDVGDCLCKAAESGEVGINFR